MLDSASRRNFLRGRFASRSNALRPPSALAEQAFRQVCTACGECSKACPTGIIGAGQGGYPEVDFTRGECTFCRACIDVCPTGALQRGEGQLGWSLRAVIGDACLARRGVECRVCGDLCLPGAIRFLPRRGGVAFSVVDAAQCTGCGACFAPCPVAAIRVG